MSTARRWVGDPAVTASWVPEMVSRIVEHFQPVRVILFGSLARGEATRDSDVDLLVVLPTVDDKHEVAIDIRRALADIPVPKDIVVTTPEEIARRGHLVGAILRPALREGRVLYERA
jgi:predicted nucleotidyltransferase